MGKLKNWWFIHGAGRTGTTYMLGLFNSNALKFSSDPGLSKIMNQADLVIGLDVDRYFSDLSDNVYENAKNGWGRQIDMVYKQANSSIKEYRFLVSMFGPPARSLFCMRAPGGYMASATKKFDEHPARLRDAYIKSFALYEETGGDILHYGPHLTKENVASYLEAINFPRNAITSERLNTFRYTGTEHKKLGSPEMHTVYRKCIADATKRSDTFSELAYLAVT
jgi:hypothetical protein